MNNQFVTYKVKGPLAIITLNRPEKLNAINVSMVDGINEAMDQAEEDHNIRAIVIQGSGKSFSAGFDLDDEVWDTKDHDAIRAVSEDDFDVIMRFWDSPKPTVAAVQGYCLGGAMEIALSCDITVASKEAMFGEPEVSIASGVVALILPWLTGPKLAKEILLMGDKKIAAQRIYEMGLINRVVELDDLNDCALELAESMAMNDRLAVEITKRAINRSLEISGMKEALLDALEADILIETSESDEAEQFNKVLHEKGIKAALDWRREYVKKLSNG